MGSFQMSANVAVRRSAVCSMLAHRSLAVAFSSLFKRQNDLLARLRPSQSILEVPALGLSSEQRIKQCRRREREREEEEEEGFR